MKKTMSVLLAAAMCSAMLAGCGSTAVSYTHLTLPTIA